MTTVIETDGLTKQWGELVAVDHIDLAVKEGECYAFLGRNGSGKSTTARLLLDFIRPTTGSSTVLGGSGGDPAIRSRVGYLPGDLNLPRAMTGDDAFAFFGGLSGSAAWAAESDQDLAHFGQSVGTAGDVNGDGYSDVIVGAPLYDNGEFTEGRAFVYHGGPSGLSPAAGWTADSDQALAFIGSAVATAGDVNGDGYADVIAGAVNYDNGEMDEGRVFVYHGSAAGLATTAAFDATR